MGLIRTIRRYLDGKENYHGAKEVGDTVVSFVFETSDLLLDGKENYHGAKEVGDTVVSFVFETSDLLLDLRTLQVATNFFSPANLIGRGGFGDVYKGLMPNGQEIAVKKLINSAMRDEEFTNEVELLSGIRHMNLVTLLGCCVEGLEKILVYEYRSNRGLNDLLFGKPYSSSLDWATRFRIVTGVARGLLYLHEESPMRIIHRDIKVSNILLDEKLNPKITDFGIAWLFREEDTQKVVLPIAGPPGYIAPEYLMHGELSVKTDVYSYGILLLEIINGRQYHDNMFSRDHCENWHEDDHAANVLHFAWKLYQAERILELVDRRLGNSYNADEVGMCIQIALLCCQESAADRPDMNSIHVMLSSDSFTLPAPGQPAFLPNTNVTTLWRGQYYF